MNDRSDLLRLLERIGGTCVACVGDIMLDRWVYGAVERISPEAPVPVLRVGRQSAMPGGVGNVARNLRALGAAVRLAAVVGEDGAGSDLRSALEDERAAITFSLIVEAGRRTPIKTRFLAGNQQLLRADDESVAPPGAAARREILATVAGWQADFPVLILSDYGKGIFADDLAAELIAAAHARGAGRRRSQGRIRALSRRRCRHPEPSRARRRDGLGSAVGRGGRVRSPPRPAFRYRRRARHRRQGRHAADRVRGRGARASGGRTRGV